MIKKRIIPTLLWSENNLVKGINFKNRRQVSDILTSIKIYNSRDVDEIIVLDINATDKRMGPDFDSIANFAQYMTVPFTYGGGIQSISDALKVLRNGADKISLNTIIFSDKSIIKNISKYAGSQSIVVSIDYLFYEGKYKCVSNSGKKIQKIDPVSLAKLCEDQGCGEILINSVDRDGTMLGYDLEFFDKIREAISLPILISGGVGEYDHMYKALKKNASAVCASSIYCFTELNPTEAKRFLKSRNIDIRDGYKY